MHALEWVTACVLREIRRVVQENYATPDLTLEEVRQNRARELLVCLSLGCYFHTPVQVYLRRPLAACVCSQHMKPLASHCLRRL